MTRLAAVDAQTYWMSARIPNDQFLLYGFAGEAGDLPAILTGLRERAVRCPDLRLRIVEDCAARYPRWKDSGVSATQFVVHPRPVAWPECLDAVAALAAAQLDPTRHAWRLHVFPTVAGPATTVAVLQISHALADGTRSSALAAWLFGRQSAVPSVWPQRRGSLLLRGVAAARAQRRLAADIATGALPAAPDPRPVLPTNTAPSGPRRLRTLVRDRAMLSAGSTVTVAALAAISSALGGHLGDRGADMSALGAEVPMADPGIRHAHNHFHNVGVGLHPEAEPAERVRRITMELRGARARSAHPAMSAERRSLAAVPAPLLRWGVRQFDPTVRPLAVTGNTVVSSVNRGAADLRFGAAPVVLTTGFPELSPMMGLTHGVHGIGETVVISVHTTESVIGDVDAYVARLDDALSASV